MYPKRLYSAEETVVVHSEAEEKKLGEGFFDSPVKAKAKYAYEGKVEEKAKKEPKEGK